MSRWVRIASPLCLLLLASSASASAGPLVEDAGHIHWLQRDNAWYRGVGVLNANGDSTPDVVIAGGDRDASYYQCLAPPGFPGATVNQHKDTVLVPAAKMGILDGRTGDPLWETAWRPGGDVVDPPSDDVWHLVSGVHTGDLDGDGADDLVVIRTEKPKDRSMDQTQHITSYDPRTGAVEWDVTQTVPADQPPIAVLTPMDVFGTPGALLTQITISIAFSGSGVDVRIDGSNQVVQLEPGKAPKKVIDLPADLGFAVPTRYGDGYRFVAFPIRISGAPPAITASVDAHAVDLVRNANGQPRFEEAWSRPAAGGTPWHISGGADPAVVVGRPTGSGTAGNVVAMDLDTGADRWTAAINVGPGGGTLVTQDVNADGVEDVIASPAFGDDPTGLLTGGPFAELHAFNGRNGQPLWAKTDPLAKFRAHALELIDIDGSGAPEIVGIMTGQDGFPMCSTPSDDTGMVSVWDAATGAQKCRLHTDRFPSDLVGANLNGEAGKEIVVPTLGGNVYSFTNAEPGCGPLGTNPL